MLVTLSGLRGDVVQMDGQKQQASSCEGLVGLSLLRMSKLSQEILKF